MRRVAAVCLVSLALGACQSSDRDADQNAGNTAVSPSASATAPAVAASSGPAMAGSVALAPQINAADFRRFDKTLASDAFGGRKPGTPGAEKTTSWLVDQFQRMGLEPGNKGSWFQKVPAESIDLANTDVKLHVKAKGKDMPFDYATDMIVGSLKAQPKVELDKAPIVFVGYGVDAPQWHWNDYAGQDVKGKIVVMLVNDPGFGSSDEKLFKGRTMTYYGRWTYKYAEAARQGAAACFIVHTSDGAAGYPWSVVVNSWSGPQLSLPASIDPAPRLAVAGWLTHDAATRLFSAAGKDFDALAGKAAQPGFKAVPLNATGSITLNNRIGHSQADNVLAMVKGSTRADEVVIYSAHWDHLGTDTSLKGHQVYSGAIDNGTGLSMLLEIADAFAHQPQPPQRSVLFFMPTMEESGLLGSQYYVAQPVFPLDKTVADLNVDALPIIGRAHDMTVIGRGQSNLEDMLGDVLKTQHRTISGETTPQNGFYFRSDHFSFAKAGVPALIASSGLDLVDGGKAAGQRAADDYTAHRYHTPQDVYNPDWDLSGILQDTQAYYELGRQLADSGMFPQWKPDSPFRAARQKMMQPAAEASSQ